MQRSQNVGSQMCFVSLSWTFQKKKMDSELKLGDCSYKLRFQLKNTLKTWQHQVIVLTGQQSTALGNGCPPSMEQGVYLPTAPTRPVTLTQAMRLPVLTCYICDIGFKIPIQPGHEVVTELNFHLLISMIAFASFQISLQAIMAACFMGQWDQLQSAMTPYLF